MLGGGRHIILLKHVVAYTKVIRLPRRVICCSTKSLVGLQVQITVEVLYIVGAAAVKTSVLYLYHRVFGAKEWFAKLLIYTGVFIWAYSIASVPIILVQCRPIAHLWNPDIPGVCIDFSLAATIVAAINCTVDVVILCLPIPLVLQLQIKPKWKIQLIGIFFLGGLYVIARTRTFRRMLIEAHSVCVGSIYRTTTLHELSWVDATCK